MTIAPKEIELKARIDEIETTLFLLNSGVSESAIRSGLLERKTQWIKKLTNNQEMLVGDIEVTQAQSIRWHRRCWTKHLPMSFCVRMFGTIFRRLFYDGPTEPSRHDR